MTEKEKQNLFDLYNDKIYELEMLFFIELEHPASYNKAFFDKENDQYIDLETYVCRQLSDKEMKRRKENRIIVREKIKKEHGEVPKFSQDIKIHQMLYSFYQNEFIPKLNRLKGRLKVGKSGPQR